MKYVFIYDQNQSISFHISNFEITFYPYDFSILRNLPEIYQLIYLAYIHRDYCEYKKIHFKSESERDKIINGCKQYNIYDKVKIFL